MAVERTDFVASDDADFLSRRLLQTAGETGRSIVTAESCTAGLLSQFLSDAPGAAQFFHGGFVTYTKEQKTRALGVSAELLIEAGAVCRAVAVEMANGALAHSPAHLSAAITGVAGPDPDEDGNPVGKVCIAAVERDGSAISAEFDFGNRGRDEIRQRAAVEALRMLIRLADG